MLQERKVFWIWERIFGVAFLACAICVPSGIAYAQTPLSNPTSANTLPTPPSGGAGMGLAMPETPAPTPSLFTAEMNKLRPANTDAAAPPLSNDPSQLAVQAEQTALQAQAQADLEQAKREQEHNTKSFQRAESGMMPLSPDQVRAFMHRFEETQEAAVPPFAGAPKAQVRITTLSLDPGTEPPVLNVSSGYVTTINMVDATGEPWPILDVGVGGNFEVSPTTAGSHVVRIMPLSRVGVGNLSVLLKDLPTPVIFKVTAGGPTVDLRYDARIDKLGPGAKAPLIERPRLEAGSEAIMLILANAPPAAAKRMKIGGLDARSMAWMMDNHVYVRTPLTLLSPAWDASVSSADGMTVYEIGDAPVLLMSDNGAIVRARLLRDDDHDR